MTTMNRPKNTTQPQQIPIDHSILTSIDEGWLLSQPETPSGSCASSLFEATCRCCGRQDCESIDIFNRAIKKSESDTRLAAEIGQGLLHKHENYVLETTQKQTQLEKQLQKYHERVSQLEQSLDETENAKDRMENEKNKWSWEYQKRQKIMDETLADLEIVNDKCNQLTKEIEAKNGEVEKLRIFKFMVRQSEIREETLRSKLDDTNQELAVCHKNELVLESKNKKLKMRYESLYANYESLLKEVSDKEGLAISLLSDVPGKKSAQQHKTQAVPMQDNDDLIGLIKEISSSNYKLKSEVLSYKEQLAESRSEIIALAQKLDDRNDQIAPTLEDDVKSKRTLTMPQKAHSTTTVTTAKRVPKRATSIKENPPSKPIEIQKSPDNKIAPTPTMSNSMPTSSSSPVVHHHYHYYLKNKENNANAPLLEEKDENETSSKSDISSNNDSMEFNNDASKKLTDSIVLSPSSSVTTFKPTSAQSPFVHLLEHVTHVLERLKNSDIRALNRKLKRAFDITELSSMSNAVIENVLMDVDTLDSRFLWVEEDGFFPVLHLLRGMLKELGTLRTTINELQVEYVKKVEESEHRVEEEILQKRAMQKKQNAPQSSPLTWLTNMFYRTNVNNSIEPVPNDKGSTLTETSTNSSSSQHTETGGDANNTPIQSRSTTLPRSVDNHKQRRRIPYPTMVTSLSTGTDSRSIPITATFRNNKRHIDSLATVLAVERDSEWQGGNLSSSWLGGK